MRLQKLFVALTSSILALWLAATPSVAALLPVNAQVQYLIQKLPPVTFTGSGVGSSVGGGIATIPTDIFSGNPAIVVPISPTFVGATRITVAANSIGNPAASFRPDGAMGLAGSVFSNSPHAGGIPLFQVGGGDEPFANTVVLGALIGDLAGVTWMGGNAVFTAMGAALAIPATIRATAYDNRTPGGQGTIQLAAPTTVNTGVFGSYPLFGILTLTYTPEPATLTLLGAGIAALAMIGRRKLEKGR
jgi:hypothetical protein